MLNADYLSNTWDDGRRPDTIDLSKKKAEWHKLDIIEIKKGMAKDKKALVVFKAYFIQGGEENALHGIGRFIKNNHRWYIQDGMVKSIAKVGLNTNLGKNALCSCGSGKKYQHCCGAA
jgi:SEC-C motif-containing protein